MRVDSNSILQRADSGQFGMTAVSGLVGNPAKHKFFGEQTLSNLGKQFPAPKSRIGDDTLSVLSKEFSLARLRLQSMKSGQSQKPKDPLL